MEAIATITKTMIVVIVVSRRVGQVTLAVSERTSCRNLKGLKAIVCGPRPKVRRMSFKGNRTAVLSPALSRRMSRQAGSLVRGISKPRRISLLGGRAAGGGYRRPEGQKVKEGGGTELAHRVRQSPRWIGQNQ